MVLLWIETTERVARHMVKIFKKQQQKNSLELILLSDANGAGQGWWHNRPNCLISERVI